MTEKEKLGSTLTVGQLIEKLSKFDSALPVMTEGCDCWGTVRDAVLCGDEKTSYFEPHIFITRD